MKYGTIQSRQTVDIKIIKKFFTLFALDPCSVLYFEDLLYNVYNRYVKITIISMWYLSKGMTGLFSSFLVFSELINDVLSLQSTISHEYVDVSKLMDNYCVRN